MFMDEDDFRSPFEEIEKANQTSNYTGREGGSLKSAVSEESGRKW
jgi:hypothetical protein